MLRRVSESRKKIHGKNILRKTDDGQNITTTHVEWWANETLARAFSMVCDR